MRLLLVDDDRGLRTLLRTTFEVFDIEVDEADSSSVALERIAARRPDVVVLDVHMPGMSGLELCRKLKTEEDTAGIGVVLLTGSDARYSRERRGGRRRRLPSQAVQPTRAALGHGAARRRPLRNSLPREEEEPG